MGAGLALAFKRWSPYNYAAYREYCLQGKLKPGEIFVTQDKGKHIINMASKSTWKANSQLSWIDSGIKAIDRYLIDNQIDSVAMPLIGTGLGNLPKALVTNLIIGHLLDGTYITHLHLN